MQRVINAILELPHFTNKEWQVISSMFSALHVQSVKGFEQFLLEQAKDNNPVTCSSEMYQRINIYLRTWSKITNRFKSISREWAEFYSHDQYKKNMGTEDLVPLLVLLLPNHFTKSELNILEKNLNRASEFAHSQLSALITNLYLAIKAKCNHDQPNEIRVIVFYIYKLFHEHEIYLARCIKNQIGNSIELNALYQFSMRKQSAVEYIFSQSDIKKLKVSYPQASNLIDKFNCIHHAVTTLSQKENPQILLKRFYKQFVRDYHIMTTRFMPKTWFEMFLHNLFETAPNKEEKFIRALSIFAAPETEQREESQLPYCANQPGYRLT